MPTKLTYAIKFVDDMPGAVAFHRDQLGLILKFESPDWSEFVSGETTLALHKASAENPAGGVQLGLSVDDIGAFHAKLTAAGVIFSQPPVAMHGVKLARFVGPDGVEVSVSGPDA